MDFIAPPMFDTLNFQTWKAKISMYLKILDIHVHLATVKDSYFVNGKYLEANTKTIHTLKSTLNNDYLSRVANIDLTFVVCNTLITLGEKCHMIRRVTRMKKVMLPTCATWSKGMTPRGKFRFWLVSCVVDYSYCISIAYCTLH